MYSLHLFLTWVLMLTLLQVVDICEADEESEVITQGKVLSSVKQYEDQVIQLEKSFLTEKFGPDVTSTQEKYRSEVKANWGNKVSDKSFDGFVFDLLIFTYNPAIFNVVDVAEFTYQANCSEFPELARLFIKLQALKEISPFTLQENSSKILVSALEICSGGQTDMNDQSMCNNDPSSLIENRFKILELKTTNLYTDLRSNIETLASTIKKECNGPLLNREDIDKLLVHYKKLYNQ